MYNQNIADQLRVFEARSHDNDRNVLETNIDLTCTFSVNRCIVCVGEITCYKRINSDGIYLSL